MIENGSESFAAVLRRLREERGMSVTDLAERAGINRVSLHKLEAGRYGPSLETAQRLARALGVGLEAFEEKKTENPL